MEKKLNLGSGKNNMSGYDNIDIVQHTPETIIGNILELKYNDNSVNEIYCAHVIEHLDKNEINKFFSECNRVLKRDGKLEIIAPDMNGIIEEFLKNKVSIDYLDDFLFARHLHKYDYHKQGIYIEKLTKLCHKYKFIINKTMYEGNFNEPEIHIKAAKK
jgi:predicted SAM-dependent methyltransferase